MLRTHTHAIARRTAARAAALPPRTIASLRTFGLVLLGLLFAVRAAFLWNDIAGFATAALSCFVLEYLLNDEETTP